MDERKAQSVAKALGGEAWQSGGGAWLVIVRRDDGRLVVLSADAVCEYESETAFDEGRASSTILLVAGIALRN